MDFRDDKSMRKTLQKDDGRFEWLLPNGTIELIDGHTFKARGGRITSEGFEGEVGVKIVKEGIYGYQQVK